MILLRTSFASGHDGRICTDPDEISTTLTNKNKKKRNKEKMQHIMKMQHIAVSSSPYQVIRDLKIRGRRMSTTAVMTEGGAGKSLASQGAKNP